VKSTLLDNVSETVSVCSISVSVSVYDVYKYNQKSHHSSHLLMIMESDSM